VELLAWMVARGYLELRVALRVHRESGKPLPYESAIDGYVHEKWALFQDAHEHWILASGSLNESRTALTLNAENLSIDADWWEGPSRDRIRDHLKDFEALWEDRHAAFRVYSLPEAVQRKLVRLAPPGEMPGEIQDPLPDKRMAATSDSRGISLKEKLRFLLLHLGPKLPGGMYVGMETAPVEPWPHQRVVARRLLDSWPGSYLLCDEVGLGKTIETGLALRSLWLSGRAERILIASPPGLGEQWLREMGDKFFLPFQLGRSGPVIRHEGWFPREERFFSKGLFAPNLLILSTGLLERPERQREMKYAPPFDVVLVDEAHALRRQNPQKPDNCRNNPEFGKLYKAVRDTVLPHTQALWLATATPMQLDWIEVYDLFCLTRRVGPFGESPTLVRAYYDILSRIISERKGSPGDLDFLRGVFKALEEQDPLYWDFLQISFDDSRVRSGKDRFWRKSGHMASSDWKYLTPFFFAGAPLSRVMFRHTRTLLHEYSKEGKLNRTLPRREIRPLPGLVFSGGEKRIYAGLEEYCEELGRVIGESAPEGETKGGHRLCSLGFYLSFLRQRCASSFYALEQSLGRRLRKVEATLRHEQGELALEEGFEEGFEEMDDETESPDDRFSGVFLKHRTPEDLEWEAAYLKSMLETMRVNRETPSKLQFLLGEMERRKASGGRIRQTVIFTRYLDTLRHILECLYRKNPSMRIGAYTGEGGSLFWNEHFRKLFPQTSCESFEGTRMMRVSREEVKKQFLQENIDVLLCTDAAAEGLNLQTADLLINFDLPWNPMKVEQRVGRIDRIGQKHDTVEVLNLCYADSVEATIYGRLLERLEGACQTVGPMPFSLLPVGEKDFQDLAAGTLSEEDLERRSREDLERQQKDFARLDISPRERLSLYCRLEEQWKKDPLPVSLEDIWKVLGESAYLQSRGAAFAEEDPRVLLLRNMNLPGVSDGTALTVDREIYETGVVSTKGDLHFASYGDPVFDGLVEYFLEHHFSEREEWMVHDTSGGYPVMGIGVRQGEEARLICSMKDLEGLVLGGSGLPLEPCFPEEREVLRMELQKRARHSRKGFSKGEQREILRRNERAQKAEACLEAHGAERLLSSWSRGVGFPENAPCAEALEKMEALLQESGERTLTGVDLELLRTLSLDLLWDLKIPRLGDSGDVAFPKLLLQASLDTAAREMDAIKGRKSEISLARVHQRIQRRVERMKEAMR
jgi:hypothetical protein